LNDDEVNAHATVRDENCVRGMVEGYDYNMDFDLHNEPNEVDHVISVEEFERNVRSMNVCVCVCV